MSREAKAALVIAGLLAAFVIASPWIVGPWIYRGPPTGPAKLPYWVEHYGDPDAALTSVKDAHEH